MSAERWALRLAWFLDALALLALAGTGEVVLPFFLGLGAVLLVSRIPRLRIPERAIFGFLILSVLTAIFVWLKLHYAPVIVVAYAAPVVHASLWFAPKTSRYRSWRLGIGFTELIIASAMTVELYLPVAIFAFVVVAAVKMSCEFLDGKLKALDADFSPRPLPPHFIRSSLGTAFLIFLTSAIIFPILPRMRGGGPFGGDSSRIGYTEDVSLQEGLPISQSGSSSVDLWLYPQDEHDLSELIYKKLIRMKVLSSFDGTRWSPDRRTHRGSALPMKGAGSEKPIAIDAIREPLGSYVLPLPYGAEDVRPTRDDLSARFQRQDTGEWIDAFASNDRLLYTFDLYPVSSPLEARRLDDAPTQSNLRLPVNLGPHNERISKLVHRIFGDAQTVPEKLGRLSYFFAHEGFRGSEQGLVNQDYLRNPIAAKMQPLERFLLLSKEGDCQWFASASSILMRSVGVPTRLATGFRISQPSIKGAIRVRSSDAHAWVEVWMDGQGWVPFDPTPRIVFIPSLLGYLRGGYDDISGYWYRYILSFNSGNSGDPAGGRTAAGKSLSISSASYSISRDLRWLTDSMGFASLIFLALLVLSAVLVTLFHFKPPRFSWFSPRLSVAEGRPEIRRERIRLERLLKSFLGDDPTISSAAGRLRERGWRDSLSVFDRWLALYELGRFGRSDQQAAVGLYPLRSLRKALKLSLRREARALNSVTVHAP